MIHYLVLINSSDSLQTSYVITFIISLCLILQMCKNLISKILRCASKQRPWHHSISVRARMREFLPPILHKSNFFKKKSTQITNRDTLV